MLVNAKINIKLKLSALWASLMTLYIYGDYFELYVPDKVDELLNGTAILDSPLTLFFAAISMAIPALMIALSLLLKPRVNRILNITFGILLTLIVILVGGSALGASWYAFYAFYALLEACITLLIVWYAWKWPIETTD